MAAHRIRVTNNNNVLPRCKSEGTLIDLDEGVTEASLIDVKGQFITLQINKGDMWYDCAMYIANQ